jgi:hypothetical protein
VGAEKVIVTRGGYEIDWRTPNSAEIARSVSRIYSLTDTASGLPFTVTEYAERRKEPRGTLALHYECSCAPGTWAHICSHTLAVQAAFPPEPTPPAQRAA